MIMDVPETTVILLGNLKLCLIMSRKPQENIHLIPIICNTKFPVYTCSNICCFNICSKSYESSEDAGDYRTLREKTEHRVYAQQEPIFHGILPIYEETSHV